MTSVSTLTLSGNIKHTIYERRGKEFISRDGKEIEVQCFRLWPSQTVLKVVKLGELYFTIDGVFTYEVHEASDTLERISRDVSVFWTKLSSLIDRVGHTPGINVNELLELSDIFIELAHVCGSQIEEEQSKSRSFILEANSLAFKTDELSQELLECSAKVNELQKKSYSFSQALKCCFNASPDSPPLLHELCQDTSASVTEIVKLLELDIHRSACVPTIKIEALSIENVEFQPIHVAAICGNASVMQELYQIDPNVAFAVTTTGNFSVWELSAFGSIECFELCKSWFGISKIVFSGENPFGPRFLKLALAGGNPKILDSFIPSPQSSTWLALVICAFHQSDLGTLDWLMEMFYGTNTSNESRSLNQPGSVCS